jgi:hypothetical protein
MIAQSVVAAVSNRRRRSEIDATIYVALYSTFLAVPLLKYFPAIFRLTDEKGGVDYPGTLTEAVPEPEILRAGRAASMLSLWLQHGSANASPFGGRLSSASPRSSISPQVLYPQRLGFRTRQVVFPGFTFSSVKYLKCVGKQGLLHFK